MCTGGVGVRWVVNMAQVPMGSWVQGDWVFGSAENGSGVRVKAAGNTQQEQPGTRGGQVLKKEVLTKNAESG